MVDGKRQEKEIVAVDKSGGGYVMSEFVARCRVVNRGCVVGNVVERLTGAAIGFGGRCWRQMRVGGGNCDVDGNIVEAVVGEWLMEGKANVGRADISGVVW